MVMRRSLFLRFFLLSSLWASVSSQRVVNQQTVSRSGFFGQKGALPSNIKSLRKKFAFKSAKKAKVGSISPASTSKPTSTVQRFGYNDSVSVTKLVQQPLVKAPVEVERETKSVSMLSRSELSSQSGSNKNDLWECADKNYLDCVRSRIFGKKYVSGLKKAGQEGKGSEFYSKRLRRIQDNRFEGDDFSLNRGRNINYEDYYLVKTSVIDDLNNFLQKIKRFSESQSQLIMLLRNQASKNKDEFKSLNQQFQSLQHNDSQLHDAFDWVMNEMRKITDEDIEGHKHDLDMDVSGLSDEELAELLGVDQSLFRRERISPLDDYMRGRVQSRVARRKQAANKTHKSGETGEGRTAPKAGMSLSNALDKNLERKLKKMKRNDEQNAGQIGRKRGDDSEQVMVDNLEQSRKTRDVSADMSVKSAGDSEASRSTRSAKREVQTQQKTKSSHSHSETSNKSSSSGRNNIHIDENTFNSGFGLTLNQDFSILHFDDLMKGLSPSQQQLGSR